MRRPQEIVKELEAIETMVMLTDVFKSIASIRIAKIKNTVLQSKQFFDELWHIYAQIHVGSDFQFGRAVSMDQSDVLDKELFVIITAEGGFSGDIDEKLIDWMLTQYDANLHDIIVIGHHGVVQLAQKGVQIKRYYKLPEKDHNINVTPIINEVQKYRDTTAYYQTYVSLMVQDVKRISLQTAVKELGSESETESTEIITEENYIFEPTTRHVIDHLERSMLQIALGQIILESKLAQHASRFKAMSTATDKAKENRDDIKLAYNRARRALQDQRLKEIVSSMKKVRA
jgi:F-type H+-transporting ATPase subunit gamma